MQVAWRGRASLAPAEARPSGERSPDLMEPDEDRGKPGGLQPAIMERRPRAGVIDGKSTKGNMGNLRAERREEPRRADKINRNGDCASAGATGARPGKQVDHFSSSRSTGAVAVLALLTSRGVPSATTRPPASPPSGPSSIT